MGSEVIRYIVPPKFGDDGPINEALDIIKKNCFLNRCSKEVTLFIPTKDALDGTEIDASLGEKVCKKLSKGEKVAINILITDELILQCKTLRTFKPNLSDKTILCIYPDDEILDKIDSVKNPELVVVVPWLEMKEVEGWQKTWNPIVLGEESQ